MTATDTPRSAPAAVPTEPASSASRSARELQKLQRAIVDGLEDVKAQDIVVFNTEALSPLFERVIVASGSSNRQTRALASSVNEQVREAGFAKPRVEGEDNGEWIIVDCSRAVVHIMQPAIRAYYDLEALWGGTPVRLKLGAARPASATKSRAANARPASAAAQKAAQAASPDAGPACSPSRSRPARRAASPASQPDAPAAPSRARRSVRQPADAAAPAATKSRAAYASPASVTAQKPAGLKAPRAAKPGAALRTVVVGAPKRKPASAAPAAPASARAARKPRV